jgi:hypothetical protein
VAAATELPGPAIPAIIGNAADYRIILVNGDCDFGPGAGHGILLVRGRLTLRSSFTWTGLILVIGEGVMEAADDATGVISGGVFIANTKGNGPGAANFGASAVTLELDLSQTNLDRYSFPYRVIATREY